MPDMPLGAGAGAGAGPALAAAKQQLRAQMKQQLTAMAPSAVAAQSAAICGALARFPPFVAARRVAVFLSMPAAEVQTDALVRHALAQGKQVFVPYLHKPGPALQAEPYVPPRVMDMVQLHSVADYQALARDRWGIPSVDAESVRTRRRILGDGEVEVGAGTDQTTKTEGEPEAETGTDTETDPETLDIILMPGVAFDLDPTTRRVHRCGHGRGFYDYFLHRYAQKTASQDQTTAPIRLYGLAFAEQVLPAGSVPTGPHDQPLDGLISGDGSVVVAEEQAGV